MKKQITIMLGVALASVLHWSVQAGESIYIQNAKVHTMGKQGTLESANVLIRQGKIVAIGADVKAENGSTIINANGKPLTPGLFNSATQIATAEIDMEDSTVDGSGNDSDVTASFHIADIINPFATSLALNKSMGLTHAIVLPGINQGVVGGQGVLINTRGEIIADRVALSATYSGNSKSNSGGSRAIMLQKFRNLFDDARDYAANKSAFVRGERREYSASFRDLDVIQNVLARQQVLMVYCHRAADILALLKLQQEYGFELAIIGASEAHRVAPALAKANVTVVLDVMSNTPDSFDQLAATFENAARLEKAGVAVAFNDSTSGHNAFWVRQNAGLAVAHGMSYDSALAGLTSVPARLVGVDKQSGKIEKGMNADMVLWDGDPLEVTSFPQTVLINGEIQDLSSRASRLRDRYQDITQQDRAFQRQPAGK